MATPLPLRLFVGAYPPEAWRAAALDALAKLSPAGEHGPAGWKAVGAEHLHLTLLFLGARKPRILPKIVESFHAALAGAGPFELAPVRLVALPERGRVRLLAVETTLPSGLAEVRKRLVMRLADEPHREQKFLPHLTLARFPGAGVERESLPSIPPPLLDTLGTFRVTEVRLVNSTLHPRGAKHETLEVGELGTPRRQPQGSQAPGVTESGGPGGRGGRGGQPRRDRGDRSGGQPGRGSGPVDGGESHAGPG